MAGSMVESASAFRAMNSPSVNCEVDRIGPERLKHAIVSFYDWLSDQKNTGCWNWGLCDEETHAYIRARLPDYDSCGSDGYSEQLYCFALNAVPLQYDGRLRILDVGCGAGAGLQFLSRLLPESEFVGLDLSTATVDSANHRLCRPDRMKFVHGDAEHLPFDDGIFDLVINIESSHTYPDFPRFFSEVRRVLRSGGFLSLADHLTAHRYGIVESCMRGTDGVQLLETRDISERVRSAVNNRMEPDSVYRRMIRRQSISKFNEHMTLLLCGAVFGKKNASPILRILSILTDSATAEHLSYYHYLAKRV